LINNLDEKTFLHIFPERFRLWKINHSMKTKNQHSFPVKSYDFISELHQSQYHANGL